MTREEIISGLKMSMELTLFDPSTGEYEEPWQLNDINRTAYEAYKGAIELLEKQPDTTTHDSIPAETGKNDGDGTSDDCIGRQAAIDTLLGITAMRNTIPLDSAIFNIKKLPTVQPERKTGRWIHLSRHKWIRTHKCDQCGNILDFDGVNAGRGDANFCPNCGADMRGEGVI